MIRTIMLLVGCLLFGNLAMAKPFTLDKEIKPYRLELAPVKSQTGAKAVTVQGRTIDKGHYYYVKGHGMMQPIDVMLEAPEDQNLSLELYLGAWTTPTRSGRTERTGFTTQQFTAYGEFGIRVVGPAAGIPYLLTVYAQPESVPDLGNPFTANQADAKTDNDINKTPETAASTAANTPAAGTSGNGQNYLLYGVIGLLVVIVVLLVALLFKKQRSTAAMLLLAGSLGISLLPSPAQAEPTNNPAEGYGPDNVRSQPGVFEAPPPPTGWGGMTSEQADKVWEGGAKTIEHLKKIKQGMDAWEAYQSLDSCMRIASPPNMPLVPSFCAAPVGQVGAGRSDRGGARVDTDENCSSCFTEARTAFNKARLDLEKLRVIYSCTKKMSNAAIAAGDSMSGIHGYSGVIWQGMRHDISRSVEKMEQTYDQKYPELLKNLHNAMLDMGRCEAEFGTPDWYDRVGFIYFEYMSDAYKRKD